jgi:hypothetical protein
MIYQIIKNEHKYARLVKNREEFVALRNSRENLENLSKARAGDEKAKAKLVQFAYNLGTLSGSALAGCKSIGSYFFHDIDCYNQSESQAMAQQIMAKKDEIGLMMLEQSASGGWHLVCKRIPGTTILENQVRIASILQLEMDTNTHDLQRVVFSTSGLPDDLLYLDDELFTEPMTEQECEAEYARIKARERNGEEQVPPEAKKSRKHYKPWLVFPSSCEEGQGVEEINSSTAIKSFKGVSYSDIIAEWWRQNDGLPQEGERNVKLYQLAVNLRAICDNNRDLLLQIIPRLGLADDEVRSIVDSACKESPKGISKAMNNVLDSLQQDVKPNNEVGDSVPPAMPVRLPKLINLLTKNTPNQYKAAVAHAVFPPLGTHLKEVEFEYTDYVLHEATLMNCLMAHTGAGKGCIDEPIRHIMADIKARDAENTRREAEWKKDCQKKGANKDKLMRPAGLVIQEIDPDMTKPALVTRMDEAEGHFVYVKLNEIDLFEQLKGQTGKQHFQLMCLAFDPGAEFGQTRIGTQSVTARPKCRFNWNACTTIQKGRRFFSRVLTDGPISRINFCTIPEMEIGAEQPIYGKYDAAFDAELKPYIDNLTSAHGVVDCPQAFKLAKKLQEECAEFARLSQDETYWNLSHRAIVIAWLKACVLYVANGCQWEKSIEAFIRWSLQYDLWCKMQFFGADIEAANSLGERIANRGPRNLLELLPDEFTLDDARRVRKQQGKDEQKTIFMIRNWMNRNYVIQNSEFSFEKSYKYKSKNNK